ncbi:MAG: thrombospondin type 3 repeat-containing protein, partial [Deltaproteobacteria bacterium]
MHNRRLVPAISCLALALAACSADTTTRDGGRRDGAPTDGVVDVRTADTHTPPPCVDTDNDGISDNLETINDDDGDGTPNTMDDDSDGDGFTDLAESVGNYPHYASGRAALACGISPDDCDADGRYNFRDLDSDNDGLTDAEELASGSNPCVTDTDGDGVDDLTEHAAGSDPTSNTSLPPADTLYVTLPYHPPGEVGDHPLREFTFSTRIRSADIMFLVDTTGSMGSTISAVQSTLSSTIIPGVVAALGAMGDARYGIAAHGDFAEGGSNPDGCMHVYQRLDANSALSQTATAHLSASGGGDGPESMAPATHALISGYGVAGYGGT